MSPDAMPDWLPAELPLLLREPPPSPKAACTATIFQCSTFTDIMATSRGDQPLQKVLILSKDTIQHRTADEAVQEMRLPV